MNEKTLLRTGLIGGVITLVCCFTPVLVIGFAAVGLSAWVAGLDYVLFPMLAMFAAMTGFALVRQRLSTTLKDGPTT
ncbi:MAG: mercury resistance system transport protein MerF [Rhodospirillaceae bacterium]|jgi:mercuric ion transport protein|nr:mercury resistance system transport protein MerF [Rhodospirillaceae bacterium]